MDYQKIYDSLIERSRNRTLKGYSERHHIVPKCMGGSNKKENLVKLTGKEHFVAHQLLIEIYPKNRGLIYAVHRFVNSASGKKINAKMYEWLRERHAKAMSGENNPMFGKHHVKKALQKMRNPRSTTINMRVPKSTTINMKGPKSKEHIANMKLNRPDFSGENHPGFGKPSKRRKPILCTTNGIIYPSITKAAKELNLHISNIVEVLKGRAKHTGGYHFEYVNK